MKHIKEYLNESLVNENLLSLAVSSSMSAASRKHLNSSNSGYNYTKKENSSPLAKWLSRGIKTIFITGGIILAQLTITIAGIAAFVCLLLGLCFDFSELIDKHVLKESLGEEIEINEGIKDKLKNGIIKLDLKNKKIKKYVEDISQLDDFKKAKENDSLKDMIKCVVDYFKQENITDKECKNLNTELS